MRCPYCGKFNIDQAVYCTSCGRDMRVPVKPAAGQQAPYQQPRPAPGQQGRPASIPGQQGRPVASPAPQTQQGLQQSRRQAPAPASSPTPPPPAPEPPAPFPPHTIAELKALEPGALSYTVVDSSMGDGRKKTVRIRYAKGAAWQQVATLLKACKEQQEEEQQAETVIIQGFHEGDASLYNFTNGQLCFDRDVRLGGETTNRYQIDTGNGFETDSIRIVLNGS